MVNYVHVVDGNAKYSIGIDDSNVFVGEDDLGQGRIFSVNDTVGRVCMAFACEVMDLRKEVAHCKICNGAEGSLPRNCPGKRMPGDVADAVYAHRMDYTDALGWFVMYESDKGLLELVR